MTPSPPSVCLAIRRMTVSEGRRELRTFTFGDSGKVAERAVRGNAFQDLAARQGFEYGLSCGLGRGDLWLRKSSMRG